MIQPVIHLFVLLGALIFASLAYRTLLIVIRWSQIALVFGMLLVSAAGIVHHAAPTWMAVLHGLVIPPAVLLASGGSLLVATRRLAGADSTNERFRTFPGRDQEHLVE